MADNLRFFDEAILYNKYACDDDPEKQMEKWFMKFVNSIPSKIRGVKLPEKDKRPAREVIIIEWAQRRASHCMFLLGRNKMIEIPLSMVYVVSSEEKKQCDGMFLKGIAVERNDSDCRFLAKAFQEIFVRTSHSCVLVGNGRDLSYLNDGSKVLKKGLGSLLCREFIGQAIAEKAIHSNGFSEDIFDAASEGVFNVFFERFYSRNMNLSKENCFQVFAEAVVNGKVSQIMIRSKMRHDELMASESGTILRQKTLIPESYR